MDFTEYQTEARKTMAYNNGPEHKIVYATIGLVGEAGELANKVKKLMRRGDDQEELLAGIRAEMGDVMWYLAALADDMGADLGEIAQENIDKLRDRYARGKIAGNGDYR